jgi:L-ascorbate metabolism protein UlaG (beta-lactamase superfamily)
MKPEGVTYWKMMREFFKSHPDTSPAKPIPSQKVDLHKLDSAHPVIVWFGHSSYFLRINGTNFLVDPVFSGNAAPVSFMVKAFAGTDVYTVDDIPFIDHLVLTHDHYDHLDFKTVKKLRDKVGQITCSLGVGSHLSYWGFDPDKINELDWWEQVSVQKNMTLTAAPARHFSGRGIKRGQSFWSSFILRTPQHVLYLGGDSGYDDHFKNIGEKEGPFDLAVLESGQYNSMWPFIHMMPEEMVQAAVDLKAKAVLPVHWAKFRLSMHPWNEPIKRVMNKAMELQMPIATPRIGEPLYINGKYLPNEWWDF